MSSDIITTKNSRQTNIKAIERDGWTAYVLPYRPDEIWVAGTDISKHLGYVDYRNHANNTFFKNREFLEKHSRLIEIPRITAKDKKKGIFLGDTLLSKNIQELRVYNEIGLNFFTSTCRTKKAKQHTLHVFEEYDRLKRLACKKFKPLEWQNSRDYGKTQRRCLTDAIQLFVEYAVAQGSGHADTYYIHFTKKIKKILGLENRERNELSSKELSILGVAEEMIAEYLLNCMDIGLPYKDAFKTTDPILYNAKGVLDFKHVALVSQDTPPSP